MSEMNNADKVFSFAALGAILHGVSSNNEEATFRIGGGIMLATALLGDVTWKKTRIAASVGWIFQKEILGPLRGPNSALAGGLGDARHQLYTMPRKWWVPNSQKDLKNCHASKAKALMLFADYNRQVIENYSGIEHSESEAEFDSLNAYHGLSGTSRAIVNIAQALWVAMPPGRPYCMSNIDIERLNGTAPAREAMETLGIKFEVPDYAEVDLLNREQAKLFKNQKEYYRFFANEDSAEAVARRRQEQQEEQESIPF